MVRGVLGLATVTAMALALCVGVTLAIEPAEAVSGPSLQVEAPAQAEVGHPIKITLRLNGATNVGGYETNVLFDKKAAEFSSLIQHTKNLTNAGRDVGSLDAVQRPGGVSIGAFSCPVEDCTRPEAGLEAKHGVGGTLELATLTVIPERAGKLEFRLEATKIVDSAGKPIGGGSGEERFVVKVGRSGAGSVHAASGGVPWELRDRSPSSRPDSSDLTEDGEVTHADAMEAAIAWTRLREGGSVCGRAARESDTDVNRDGCIDIADLQKIVASYGTSAENYARSTAKSGRGAPNLALVAVSSLLDWIAPDPALAQGVSTFTVDSEADNADANPGDGLCATSQGACTLRAAIQETNLHPGPDTIAFNIPGGGLKTISLGSLLPTINDESGPTTIDGYTQPDSSPNTDPLASNANIRVQITTTTNHTRDGLVVTSPSNTIRGLALFKLKRPVWFYGDAADSNTLVGSFVGTDAAGNYAAAGKVSNADGVVMQAGASSNTIGGTSEANRNVVSGNANRGIVTIAQVTTSSRIINNIVGLGPAGDKKLPNVGHGIDINGGSSHNQVGGTSGGERNVISGNGGNAVEVSHEPTTTQNKVVGNFIGTDLTGNSAPAYASNGDWGVHLQDRVTNNTVSDNVVGNNAKGGIDALQSATNNVIENNRIGISLNGSRIPNSSSGVQIASDSSGQRIGPGNIIAYNHLDGVRVGSSTSDRNTITRNSIFSNRGLGIDLEPLGEPNPNDADDADGGANEQLNFPVLEVVTPQRVTGTACSNCTVEVFLTDGGGDTHGEGKTLLGSAVAGTDGNFAVTVSGISDGDQATATATDEAGNTSEFSSNRAVSDDAEAPAAPVDLTATASPGSVTLDWADNTESDLAGYSVYRSTTSGGPYNQITSSLLPSSSYTDDNVVEGTAYYYVVTATDTVGNESGFGNEASAAPQTIALSFDGTDDLVSIPDSNLLNNAGTKQRTYELRLKTGADVNTRQFVYKEGGDSNGFSVEIQGGRIYFNAWSTGNGWNTVSAGAAIDPNTTYNVAGVYHQPSGEVRMYLHGVLRETSSGAGVMKAHGGPTRLGGLEGSTRDHNHTSVKSGGYYGGLISEFRAWSSALSQTQIEDNMRTDPTGSESGLIVLYRINEGSGTVLDDSTPNNLDGTINGASWVTDP